MSVASSNSSHKTKGKIKKSKENKIVNTGLLDQEVKVKKKGNILQVADVIIKNAKEDGKQDSIAPFFQVLSDDCNEGGGINEEIRPNSVKDQEKSKHASDKKEKGVDKSKSQPTSSDSEIMNKSSTKKKASKQVSNSTKNMKHSSRAVTKIDDSDSSSKKSKIVKNKNKDNTNNNIKNSTDKRENKNASITETNENQITDSRNTAKPIKNAFAFLMDCRNKVIGQNSPGKEIEKQQTLESQKEKLAVRKELFQNWADSKGAKKRRLEDEELGVTIEHKLEQRAKRLKKMLTRDTPPKQTTNLESDNGSASKRDSKRSRALRNIKEVQNRDPLCKKNDIPTITIRDESSNSECNLSSGHQKLTTKKKPLQQTELSNFFGVLDKNVVSEAQGDSDRSFKKLKPANKHKQVTVVSSDDIGVTANTNGSILDKTVNEKKPTLVISQSHKKWKMRLRLSINDFDDDTIGNFVSPNKKSHHNKGTLASTDGGNNQDSPNLNVDLCVKHSNESQDANKDQVGIKMKAILIDSDSNSDEPLLVPGPRQELTKKSQIPIKIAPLFLKALPKPKPDKETLKARKQFLHSELPNALKKKKEKNTRSQDFNYPIFPTISHITVKPTEEQTNSLINFWNLPAVSLQLQDEIAYRPEVTLLKLGELTDSARIGTIAADLKEFKKVTNMKEEIKKIKNENPSYPVFKSFRFLSSKHLISDNTKPDTPKTIKKSKRQHLKGKSKPTEESEIKPVQCNVWSELYKPCNSEEIFSNYSNVKSIKKWLQIWLEFRDEINKNIRKRSNSNSSSDFETTDVDSKDSSDLPGNTLILCGPHGSGKSSTIYALCDELGIGVLESNSSSKRTGKILLKELQETSQSHGVPEFQTSFQNLNKKDVESASQKRMHLLLIEDVDIVFEQDESFLAAVNQLIGMSKRPIILTTTDMNCLHLKKLVSQHTVIEFTPVSSKILAPWLQVLCLIEGISVSKQTIVELLERYNGDVRCTLLKLQFYIQSTDHAKIETHNLKKISSGANEKDEPNISYTTKNENVTEECNSYSRTKCDTIKPLDLGQIWWNIPQLLNMPPLLHLNQKNSETVNNEIETATKETLQNFDTNVLLQICDIFDAFALTDVFYNNKVDCDLEPVHKNKTVNVKRSLEESESMESSYFSRDLTIEISHNLVNGSINYSGAVSNLVLHRGLHEKRWRSKQYKCGETLLQRVSLMHSLDRTALIDYSTTLRTITKSETARESSNIKRKNRFYNYLSGLGISVNDSIIKTANNAFLSET